MPNVVLNRSSSRSAKKFERFIVLLGCLCFGWSGSNAYAFDFLTAHGSHPIAGLIGFPRALPTNTFRIPGSGAVQSSFPALAVSLQTDHSNIFAGGSRGGERVNLDGETTRTTFALSLGVGYCWQVASDVQFVQHRAGSLDRLIEKWHTFFHLPNARRDQSERDQLALSYESTDNQLSLQNSVGGMGDTLLQVSLRGDCSLTGKRRNTPSSGLANGSWFAGVKLPTGRLDEFSGSEATDYFLGYHSGSFEWGRLLTAGFRAGFLFPGESDVLPGLSSTVMFANSGLQWHPSWLTRYRSHVAVQLDMHSPLFDSELRELGAWSGQLGIGFNWSPAKGHQLTFAFLEDVVIDTSPDLVFHLKYRVFR